MVDVLAPDGGFTKLLALPIHLSPFRLCSNEDARQTTTPPADHLAKYLPWRCRADKRIKPSDHSTLTSRGNSWLDNSPGTGQPPGFCSAGH